MIINLDLENPDSDYLLSLVDQLEKKDSSVRDAAFEKFKRQQFYSPLLNQVMFEPYWCTELKNYVDRVYQPHFTHTLHPVIVRLKNRIPGHSKLACYMPHTDRDRAIGLNFCIKPGGPDVTTIFYKERANLNIKNAPYKSYDDLTVASVNQLNDKKWVALDTHCYHSVENIADERILFSLGVREISLSRFKSIYPNLIV